MKKKNLILLAAFGAALGAAAVGAAVVTRSRQKRLNGAMDKSLPLNRNVYIAGGGIAGLSAAYYLIRDCNIPGDNIYIFEASGDIGGALNIGGDCETGFVCTPPKNITLTTHPNLMDMLSTLRSASIPDITVKDEIINFMTANPVYENGRIIDEDGNTVSEGFGLDKASVKRIKDLLRSDDRDISNISIREFFSDLPEFLRSNFWVLISSAYMIKPASSAGELKNIINSIAGEIDDLFTMKNTLRAQFNLQETVISALKIYLQSHNVNFATHCRVTDAEFDSDSNRINTIHLDDNGTFKTFYLNCNDLFFVTNGSPSESASIGDYNYPAPVSETPPASAELWKKIAERRDGYGRPDVFYNNDDSEIISFTITAKSRALADAIREASVNTYLDGALTTFKDSPWQLCVSTVSQPYFDAQTSDVTVICGYGLNISVPGKYVEREMRYASGAEILFELVRCLGIGDRWDELTEDIINVIPCALPYAAAAYAPHAKGDKPVTDGTSNLAFIGQFSGSGSGMTRSIEYAVQTARDAAYRLTRTKRSAAPAPKTSRAAYMKLFTALKK